MIKFLDLQQVTAKYKDEIHEAVNRVIDSGWYLQGKENEKFEADYSAYIGTKYTVGCANGLDALIWIFRAYVEMGIMKAGDEVIVPANTYIASILAISENGLRPILVEPSIETYQIDDSKIEEFITERTKAILIVHLYGQCAYTEKIGELCKKYNLKLRRGHLPAGSPGAGQFRRDGADSRAARVFGAEALGNRGGFSADREFVVPFRCSADPFPRGSGRTDPPLPVVCSDDLRRTAVRPAGGTRARAFVQHRADSAAQRRVREPPGSRSAAGSLQG